MSEDPKVGVLERVLDITVAIVMLIAAVFCWIVLSLGLYDFLGDIVRSQPFEWKKVFAILVFGWLTTITTYITWWCLRRPAVPQSKTSMNPWLLWSSVLIVCTGFGLSVYTDPGKYGHDWVWMPLLLCFCASISRHKSK